MVTKAKTGLRTPAEFTDPFLSAFDDVFAEDLDDWIDANAADIRLFLQAAAPGDFPTYDSGTGNVAWGNFTLGTSRSGGILSIATGSIAIADGQCLYVDAPTRPFAGQVVVPAVASIPQLGRDRIVIGVRKGTDFYLFVNRGQGNPTPHAATHKGGGVDVIDSATPSVAGLMSAADKLKLDTLAGGDVTTPVRNETGGPLSKHKLVYVSGYSGTHSRPLVGYADKDDPAKRPCIGILTADLPDNSNADALVVGTLTGVDTSSWALTDQLVLGAGGAISRPPPDQDPFTGEVQNIGSVSVVHASTGQIVVSIDGMTPVTASQVFALAGTNGTPSKTNKYVTNSDPRMTDDRNDPYAIHDNIAAEISPVTLKALPKLDDVVLIESQADSWAKRRSPLGGLPGGVYAKALMTGWLDTQQYTLSFVDGTRTLTLAAVSGTFTFYQAGAEYSKVNDSIVLANTEGLHMVYYAGSTLASVVNPSEAFVINVLKSNTLVTFLYWDATGAVSIYGGYESHTRNMPYPTHINLHLTRGGQYLSGNDATNVLADQSGDLNTHAQFGLTSGEMIDEDVATVSAGVGSTTGLPIYHLEGTAPNIVARMVTNPGFAVRTAGTGRLAFNQNSGGTWSVVEAGNNDFVLCHVLASNDFVESRKLVAWMGQGSYNTIGEARAAAPAEIDSLVTGRIAGQEYVKLYTFILQTSDSYANVVKGRIRTVDVAGAEFIDHRGTDAFGAGGGTSVSPVFSDADFALFKDADPTALIDFSLTAVSTATTRVISVPDKDITLDDAGDSRTPTAHASTHDAGGADAMAIDAVAGTGSLRTLGTGAQQACAGNDSRLSDARPPTAHASSHDAGGADVMAIDAVAGTGSLRTLGAGAQQACAGNDVRLQAQVAYIKPGGGGDYTSIAAAITALGTYGTRLILEGGVNHDISTSVDLRGVELIAGGGGYPTIRAQTGGSLIVGGTYFRGCKIEAPSTGFTGTYLLNISDAPVTFKECSFAPDTGKYILGASASQTSPTIIFVNCGQPDQDGGMVVAAAPLTTPSFVILGTNAEGIMQFGAWNIIENNQGLATTTGTILGIPGDTYYVSPGESIQARLDSIGSNGGEVILLPGIHDVTNSVNITKDKTTLRGIGNPTIRALTSTWAGGTTNNDALVNLGTTNGLTPVDDCHVSALTISVEPNIHGFQVNGGLDNQVRNCLAYSAALKSSLRVAFLFTDSSANPGERFVCANNRATSASGATAWVDAVHFDGGSALGSYGYNNGIIDSIMEGSLSKWVRETTYGLNLCTACAIFNNRGNEVDVGATGSYGMAVIDSHKCNIANNSLIGSGSTGTVGLALINGCTQNSVEENVIDGDGTVFQDGITLDDDSDDNVIKGNILDECSWGVYVYSGGGVRNHFQNKFLTVTTWMTGRPGNFYIPKVSGGAGTPGGSVTGVYGDMYENTTTGDWYRNINTDGSGTTWEAIGIFGSQYQYAVSEAESSKSAATYSVKVSLTTPSLPSGNYMIKYQAEFYDGAGDDTNLQVRDAGTEIAVHYNDDDVWNSYRLASGYKVSNISGVHTIDMRYRGDGTGLTYIRRARLCIFRVS